MGTVRSITWFHTGGFVISGRLLCTALPARRAFHPFSAAVIDHSEHGPILFDTGLGSRTAELMALRPFRLFARLARVIYADHHQLRCKLEDLGVEPASVAHVIISHLHFDHTGGMRDLPAALFHVSRREWDAQHEVHGLKALLAGVVAEDFRSCPVELHALEGDGEWPFAGSYDLFGDGSIVLVSTPGHTPGHLSALVTLESGQQALLAGDAVMVQQNYTIPADQSMVSKRIRWDHELAWRTILQIRARWRANPNLLVVPTHDARLGKRLRRGPYVVT
jgi:glyoxylase-like metal-dependent hydrolase (beta-lactamase superfamily II)